MIGFYNYTVLLTYLGVLSAICGIAYASGGNQSMAIVCLMFSGFCDLFDGTVARTRARTAPERKFGIQIDSLADLICFGVLPVVIGYSIGLTRWFEVLPMGLYTLAALIRLAYYNVTEDALQSDDQARVHYEGLPVTTVALLIPLLYVLRPVTGGAFRFLYLGWLMLIACAFLTRMKIRKLGLWGMAGMALLGAAVLVCLIMGWGYNIVF